MRLFEPLMTIIAILAAAALLTAAANKIFKLEDDNVVEEFVEEVIADQTGLDIDISMGTPEKD